MGIMNVNFNMKGERRDGFGGERDRVVKTFSTPGEAMDYIRGITDPYRYNSTWELVVEGGFDDGVNSNKIERTFEYENTRNGDYLGIKYYVEHKYGES